MSYSNDLAEQMGVGADDEPFVPQEDDDLLMAKPCPGCDQECPGYAAYVAERWLAVDAAESDS